MFALKGCMEYMSIKRRRRRRRKTTGRRPGCATGAPIRVAWLAT